MEIEMHEVESTNILAYGYDPDLKTLRVKFKGYRRQRDGVEVPPKTYDYIGVEPELYETFKNADSIGRYFHTHIRSGSYGVSQYE